MYTLITGASSGIGLELAKVFAQNKHDLILVARREEKLREIANDLASTHGIKAEVIVKDLSLETAPQEIYNEVKFRNLEVDILVNNAGFGGQGAFHEREWQKDRNMIQVNIVALTALTRLFLPDFVGRGSGKILNVSSTASLMPGPLQAVYFATKAYVRSFTNAIADELRDTGVTVTNLMPGAIDTGFAKTANLDDTELFAHTVGPAIVARDAFEATMAGDMDVFSGITWFRKLQLKLIGLMPKKQLLKMIREMQETK